VEPQPTPTIWKERECAGRPAIKSLSKEKKMSFLLFDRQTRRVGLATRAGGDIDLIGIWPAHNEVDSTSRGIWPDGEYDYLGYNPHPEMGYAPACFHSAYGCLGIHLFEVDSRSGMGVHAGRTLGKSLQVGGVTYGCIRVAVEAMTAINRTHGVNPLTGIIVTSNLETMAKSLRAELKSELKRVS
jgi:hypothetical protein